MCYQKEQYAELMNAKEVPWILMPALLVMRYVQEIATNI